MGRRKSKEPFTLEHLAKFYGAVRDETDRAAVILGASMIHEHMKSLLVRTLRAFVPHKSGAEDPFFSGPQPLLESFSNCIHLAHRIHIIGPRSFKELHRIREMRNACAHSWDPPDLEASPYREYIDELGQGLGKTWESFKDSPLPDTMLGAKTRASLKLRLSVTMFAFAFWQMGDNKLPFLYYVAGGETGFLGR